MASSSKTDGPGSKRVSTYFILTFYRNNRVIINTNAIGTVKTNTQLAVEKVMGFTKPHQISHVPNLMGTLYLHDLRPFDSKCSTEQRASMQVLLCVLFTEMYKLGWKTHGDSSVDTWKRRGNIVFK